MEQFDEAAISKLDISDGLLLKNSSLNKNVVLGINSYGSLTVNGKDIATIVKGIAKEAVETYEYSFETNDAIDITNPVDANLPKVTSETLNDTDTLLVWNQEAQQWESLTIREFKYTTTEVAARVQGSLNYDITGTLADRSPEVSYNGSKTVNIVVYQPNQEVNKNSTVEFSKVYAAGITSNSLLTLRGESVNIVGNFISVRTSTGDTATITANIFGNVYGNANTSDKVNNKLTLTPVDASSDASITSIYDGSQTVNFKIYSPNQTLNTTSNVDFTSVTALEFNGHLTGDVQGNATSANKVNHSHNITTKNTLTSPTSNTFNGSKDVITEIYVPNQEVNDNSVVTFESAQVKGNILTTTLSVNGASTFGNNVIIEQPYMLLGDVRGNATSADKVNHKLTINSTSNINNTSDEIVFNGFKDETVVTFVPNQNVNTTSSVQFARATVDELKTPKVVITGANNDMIGSFSADSAGRSVLSADIIEGTTTAAEKVTHTLETTVGQVLVDASGDSIMQNSDKVVFDGSKNTSLTIKYYDDEVQNLKAADNINTTAITNEATRATTAENNLQLQIDSIGQSIEGITSFEIVKVDELPATGLPGTMYLKKEDPESDVYTEYLWLNGNWEPVGVTSTELGNYVSKSEFETYKKSYENFIDGKLEEIRNVADGESTNRKEDIEFVKKQLAEEASIRNDADTSIRVALANEAQIREQFDTQIDKRLTAEVLAREESEKMINAAIEAEAAERKAADAGLQQELDDLEFIKSAEAPNRNLILKNRDGSTAVSINVPKDLIEGKNIIITEIDGDDRRHLIEAIDTTYKAGHGIIIDEENENEISVDVENLMASEDGPGFISAEEYKKLLNLKDVQYELQLDEFNRHKLKLVGTDYSVSEVLLPDENTTYEFDTSGYDLVITPSDGSQRRMPIPQKDTTYTIRLVDHEFYLTDSNNEEQHITLPDNDTVIDPGPGIIYDKETYKTSVDIAYIKENLPGSGGIMSMSQAEFDRRIAIEDPDNEDFISDSTLIVIM